MKKLITQQEKIELYKKIVDNLIKMNIFRNGDIKNQIIELNKSINRVVGKATLENDYVVIKKLVEKYSKSIIDTDLITRGRGHNYIYEINKELIKENIENLIKAQLGIEIEKTLSQGTGEVSMEEVKGNQVTMTAVETAKKRNYTSSRSAVNNILRTIEYLKERGQNEILFSDIPKIKGITICNFSARQLKIWEDAVKIPLDVICLGASDGTRSKKIIFKNINNTYINVGNKYRDLFGQDSTPIAKVLQNKKTKEAFIRNPLENVKTGKFRAIPSSRRVIGSGDDYLNAYIKYATAGIIKSAEKITVDTTDLLGTLNKEFGIKVERSTYLDLIRSEKEFVINLHGANVRFQDKDTSFDVLFEKYGPKNFKLSCIARIGMNPDELGKIYSKFTVESVISENDNIYQLEYDRSKTSLLELVKLYRTFRGIDMIFDSNLVSELKREIELLDIATGKNRLAYLIETL